MKIVLDPAIFKTVVEATPLVSIDLIAYHEGKILLGRRKNRPAQGFWFTTGGRILKNEPLAVAKRRIANVELGLQSLPSPPRFVGVFEHFYDDGVFEGIDTHYVNLAYRLDLDAPCQPPTVQHDAYRWFTIDELLSDEDVHPYVKLYFTKDSSWQTKK